MTTAASEKDDKTRARRKWRRKANSGSPEEAPALRQVANVWTMAKDGKLRFDPRQHPKRMRK